MDGTLPLEQQKSALTEQMPQSAEKRASLDETLAQGRMDRITEVVNQEAAHVQQEATILSQAAKTEGDPDAQAANQEIALADQEVTQKIEAAKLDTEKELQEVTKEVVVGPAPDAMGALQGETMPVQEMTFTASAVNDNEAIAEAPTSSLEQQLKAVESLATGAKQRMKEIYESLLKMSQSGGELTADELEVYKTMLDADPTLNAFVGKMQSEFVNPKNEGSVRARSAQLAIEFAQGARAQIAFAEGLANPQAKFEQPPIPQPKAEAAAPASEVPALKEKALPSPAEIKKLEQDVASRLQQMDQLAFQIMKGDGLDDVAKMGLREQLEAMQQENVLGWDALSESGSPRNEALSDMQQRTTDMLHVLDQMLAENDPAKVQEYTQQIVGLRALNAVDRESHQKQVLEDAAQEKESIENAPILEKIAERNATLIGLMNQAEGLMESFKKNGLKAGPDEVRALRKLMVQAHPDKHPGDIGMENFFKNLGSLKMAFEGDMNSWKNPRGVSLEVDFANFRKDIGVDPVAENDERVAEEPAPLKAEVTAEAIPQPEKREIAGPNEIVNEKAENEQMLGTLEEIMSEKIRKVEAAFDEVLEEGDEAKIAAAALLMKTLYRGHMEGITKGINVFYKIPAGQRGKMDKKKNEIAEYNEELLGAQMDVHREKADLAKYKRMKIAVDAEVLNLEKQIKEFKPAVGANLLNAAATTDKMVLAPDAAGISIEIPAELTAQLDQALHRQKEFTQEISLRQGALDSLNTNIARIIALRLKSLGELKTMQDEPALEMVDKGLEMSTTANLDTEYQEQDYDVAEGAAAPEKYKEGWFEKIGDVVAEAMHGDQASIHGAEKLISEAKETFFAKLEGRSGKQESGYRAPKARQVAPQRSKRVGEAPRSEEKIKSIESASESEMSMDQMKESITKLLEDHSPEGYSDKDLAKFLRKEAEAQKIAGPTDADTYEALRQLAEYSVIAKDDKKWKMAHSIKSDEKKAA